VLWRRGSKKIQMMILRYGIFKLLIQDPAKVGKNKPKTMTSKFVKGEDTDDEFAVLPLRPV
jgi:hypothetical protein